MKQSCYFAKVCNREFIKKHKGVNLSSLQLCVHEYRLASLRERGTKVVSRCWGLFLEDSRAIVRRFA